MRLTFCLTPARVTRDSNSLKGDFAMAKKRKAAKKAGKAKKAGGARKKK
jgi:hypothetical protein